ncbi:choline transporter [Acinetobacter indicus]|uniref:Choline transporter n=1 Tax=Acinetobacter indicus TaxID=756892 RepID=A0AAW8YZ19_9GAMM|nr:choline transporter [Acinetobacter indicus]MCO8089219.1 choline transporter [Acinetobacter indicus]MCO8100537.1 choline transporter [Acinetobacter indicus]MCO8103679.1 choline transporter [Acinetobacter indicus]MCO8106060.1 choline transporter [Acinetobacter indicus]MCO8111749.1 choline transporter [Acinetobacter indicus]
MQKKTEQTTDSLNKVVFFLSATLILLFSLVTILFNNQANQLITQILNWVSRTFSWYYLLAATLYLVFVLFIALSRYGDIKLGPKHSKPEFSLLSWSAMLFSAGIGIDLMFFSVAEPLSHYMSPPVGEAETFEAARQSMVWTLFHYGLTGWSMYALIGVALGYFSYRYNLPLTIRSALYPIFGKRINGPIGHTVDTAAVLGTIFGIATTCGIGVVQLNYGLHVLFGLPENIWIQTALIGVAVIITIISVTAGVNKGIRVLSEINIYVSIGLLLFILFMGNTEFLLAALIQNFGDYLSQFPKLSLSSFPFEQPKEWMNSWTLFFWAWWIAWSPFVGLFLARISRGRTIREFVTGTLVIPLLFTLTWLSIFGNSALYSVIFDGNTQLATTVLENPAHGFYDLLAQYPGFTFLAGVATITGLLFYVTSADSGALVLGNFTTKFTNIEHDSPRWLSVFWAIAIGLLTLAMLMANGVTALQNTTIIMGLPFSFVIFFVMAGLYKSLRLEDFRQASTSLNAAPVVGNVDILNWKKRLSRVMLHPSLSQTRTMLDNVCKPAIEAVATELIDKGIQVNIQEKPLEEEPELYHLDLTIQLDEEENFVYEIWPVRYDTPNFSSRGKRTKRYYYRLESYLFEGSQGNDLVGYSKEQVINDILDKYERHLMFLHINRISPGKRPLFPDPDQ